MKINKILYNFSLLLLFCSSQLFAQLETSHWFFGVNVGIDFSTGTAVEDLQGQLITSEGCATISDVDGNLLFYTDGEDDTFNANHLPLLNGDGLLGDSSSSQSAIIVPNPSNNGVYYIFTVDGDDFLVTDDDDGDGNPNDNYGLNYSVVDMALDGGLGGIINTQKNINLLPITSEKITAVKHGSNDNYWVVTHFEDKFYSYLVSSAGVSSVPVISQIGVNIPYIDSDNPDIYHYPTNSRGYIKLSPNGEKLAIAHLSALQHYPDNIEFDVVEFSNNNYAYSTNGVLALYDFDANTGVVSNEIIVNDAASFYGVEFSPNSTKLYANEEYFDQDLRPVDHQYRNLNVNWQKSVVAQYDLAAADISNSRFEFPNSNFNFNLSLAEFGSRGALQLAIDGKIYYTTRSNFNLHIIDQPNIQGVNSNFIRDAFPISNQTLYGLPPFITSFFNNQLEVDGEIQNEDVCINQSANFSVSVDDSVTNLTQISWDFGDGSPIVIGDTVSHIYTAQGTYIVTAQMLIGTNVTIPVTTQITVNPLPQPVAINLVQCDNNFDGFSQFNLEEAKQLIIPNSDDFEITFHLNQTEAENNANAVLLNYTNTTNSQVLVARVVNNLGCVNYSTVTLNINSEVFTLSDIRMCDDDYDQKLIFDLSDKINEIRTLTGTTTEPITFFTSQENAAYNQFPILSTQFENLTNPQPIWARVGNGESCTALVNFNLVVLEKPFLEIADDKFCEGEDYTLQAPSGFNSYLWNTGETTSQITITQQGVYTVTVSYDYGDVICEYTETVEILFSDLPLITEVIVEENDIEIIAVGDVPLEYSLDGITWQNSRFFTDLPFGVYNAFVRNAFGCISRAKNFGVLNIPNVITPNGDGINDAWNLIGLEAYPDAIIQIYDRYGKLLVDFIVPEPEFELLNGDIPSVTTNATPFYVWDGKYLGRAVPSTSYWYIIKLPDGRELNGYLVVKNRNSDN